MFGMKDYGLAIGRFDCFKKILTELLSHPLSRIATVMFYLSSLVGGYTAFPNLGVAARPREGTAVFWFNLEQDGVRSELSLHGACPTALGIKWVSNKWIREGAQISRRPCPAWD